MIDNIIQSVTEKLSSLPYIEGIVLGGSRARGTHTEDSDIDIGIYYKSESFDITSVKYSLDFVACVFCIPLIHNIQERSKVIIRSIITINTVVYCKETKIFLWK